MSLNDINDDDDIVVKRVNAAVKIALDKNRAMDPEYCLWSKDANQMVYALRSNGERVPVAKRSWKGRYSERTTEKTWDCCFCRTEWFREKYIHWSLAPPHGLY